MGASQSELEAWEDEGPAVTRDRVARLVAAKEGVPVEEVDLGELEESAGKENGEGFASDLVKVTHAIYKLPFDSRNIRK